jgi:hypothetical protein
VRKGGKCKRVRYELKERGSEKERERGRERERERERVREGERKRVFFAHSL